MLIIYPVKVILIDEQHKIAVWGFLCACGQTSQSCSFLLKVVHVHKLCFLFVLLYCITHMFEFLSLFLS